MGSRHVRGPLVYNTYTTVLTGNYTVVNESLVVVNKTVGAATQVTLPPSVAADGRREVVVTDGLGDAGTNNITIVPAGSDTINGTSSYVMAANYGRVRLLDCGSGNWTAAAGVELTATQADFLSSVTAGTGAASKALVLNSSGNVAMPTAGIIGLSRATIAAAGTVASDATVLTGQINAVTGADNAKGVALPAAATTTGPIWVINTSATARLFVYPVSGGNDQINGLAEDLALEVGPGEAASFVPTSGTQWYAGVPHNRFNAEVVSATKTVTAFENGKTFFLNSATEFVTTLPTAAAGLRYTFIVSAAPSGASYTIITAASANIIKGLQNSVAGDAGDSGTADDTITFVDGQAVAGDKVELYCDGTSWFAYAISKVAAGVTFTQASA